MQGWGLFIAVFLACAVEAVEAVTIVLAAGTGRKDWRSAGEGVFAALAVLAVTVAVLGPALTAIPLQTLRLLVGGLLLVFGLQWLRKAILRASGYKSLHDEAAISVPNGTPRWLHQRGPVALKRLVRVHAVLQRGPLGRARGRVHRTDLREQPTQPAARGRSLPYPPSSSSPEPAWQCAHRWLGCQRTG